MEDSGLLERIDGENESQYIWRVGQLVDQGKFKWKDITPIINSIWREDGVIYTESKYRKEYQCWLKGFKDGVFADNNDDAYISELKEMVDAFEKEKVKLRDERNAKRKDYREEGRLEENLDLLEDKLLSIQNLQFPIQEHAHICSDNDMLVILSDLHIGQTFDSYFGRYNTDIAKDRLIQLANEVIKMQDLYQCENLYVSLQGDLISGNIHKTIQISNREDVIDQITIATELISNFIYALSPKFTNVYLSNVAGNHTRLQKKDESVHNERLDKLISWAIGLSLNGKDKYASNFTVLNNNLDIGIALINIRGLNYISVHGDYDSYSKNGARSLGNMLDIKPYAILYGHLHTCGVLDEDNVKLIRGGTLAGCGDDYTIEKRLSGKPSQMICICNEQGLEVSKIVTLK